MDTASTPWNEQPNLCRYCRGIFHARRPSDLVVDRNSWDGISRFQYWEEGRIRRRQMFSVDSVAATAKQGCLLCIQLLGPLGNKHRREIERFEASLDDQKRCGIIYCRDLFVSDPNKDWEILHATLLFCVRQRPGEPAPLLDTARPDALSHAVNDVPNSFSPFKLDIRSGTGVEHGANTGHISRSTSSEETLSLLLSWVRPCVEAQSIHRSNPRVIPGYLPSRLLHLTGLGTVKLLVVKGDTPVRPYATLSHCWGSEMPLRLLSSNLVDFQREIPKKDLGRTFADAVHIAEKMGLQYLWIDSLCIVQDEKGDWATESAAMGNVYSNSYCNIAAAHAVNGSGGCFTDRDPLCVQPVTFPVDWQQPHKFFTVPKWCLDSTPLSRRAWVCQEIYLAPRCVYFCADQIYWQCADLSANESFPRGHPSLKLLNANYQSLDLDHFKDTRGRLIMPPLANRGSRVFDLWEQIICNYSKGELTFDCDKLVAISGLGRRLHKYTECRYLAGLWEKHLPYHLLWEVKGGSSTRRYKGYIAPSWSWASIKGEIGVTYPLVRYRDEHDVVVQILKADITLTDPNDPFGSVNDGYIRMECYLLQGSGPYLPVPHKFKLYSTPDGLTFGHGCCQDPSSKDRMAIFYHIDVVEQPPDNMESYSESRMDTNSLWFVPITAATEDEVNQVRSRYPHGPIMPIIEGLVLAAVDKGQNVFRRIGRFYMSENVEGKEKMPPVPSIHFKTGGRFQDVATRQVITLV
ncbi:Heterokaryon incompatibility protein (HET) domain containing protein [Naviculisporaceae sp. PSN 640]